MTMSLERPWGSIDRLSAHGTSLELVINIQTPKTLGLVVSPPLLAVPDELIE
jgi:hypothetical protein